MALAPLMAAVCTALTRATHPLSTAYYGTTRQASALKLPSEQDRYDNQIFYYYDKMDEILKEFKWVK